MNESTDERLDVIAAIEEASNHDRRRALRIKRKIATQITPWSVGIAAVPFQVIIEDISETGVGVLHTHPLPQNQRYLITVPRRYHGPQIVECKVVRSEPIGQNLHKIGLEACQKIEHVDQAKSELRVTSTRTKILFLLFGIIGLAIAALVPL